MKTIALYSIGVWAIVHGHTFKNTPAASRKRIGGRCPVGQTPVSHRRRSLIELRAY